MHSKWIALSLCLAAGTAVAAGSSLPRAVADLLTEVESLGQEISLLRAETQSLRIEGAAQLAALDGDVEAERRRLADLQQSARDRRPPGDDDQDDLRAAVSYGLQEARALITKGAPYRVAERTQELDDLAASLDAGAPPAEVAARLFSFLDDHRRLATRIGRDTVDVTGPDGTRRLGTALRMGTLALFAETQSGAVLRTDTHADGTYAWTTLEGPDAQLVQEALEAMKNGKQAGQFTLPVGPLPTQKSAAPVVETTP